MSQRLIGMKALAAAAAISLGLISSAKAVSKDLSAFGWMAEMDPGVDLTILSTSNNGITLSLEKFADFTTGVNANGIIDPLKIVFRQISSSAVPNISIDNETVLNDTGTSWSGFRFIVEGGLSNNGAVPAFDTAASAGFSVDPFTTSTFSADSKELDATGGTLTSGAFPSNLFSPGQASGALVIAADPFASGSVSQTFVFKEQPITGPSTGPVIPLPAAAWTSLSGLLGLGLISKAKNLKKILS